VWGRRREHGRKNRGAEAWGRSSRIYFVTNMLVSPVILKVGAEKKGLFSEFSQKNEPLKSWKSPYSVM
jgi:hypothetical protein